MTPTQRIIVNTAAQYAKAIINTILSLYSTRLVLDALSFSDYGIYSVVGGIVVMLGYITNSMLITTQRFISYSMGQNDTSTVRRVFVNSWMLHISITLVFILALFGIQDYVFGSVLKIEPNRIEAAKMVYISTIVMLVFTILTAPFKAMYIARENIVFIAVVETVDAIVKFALAIGLQFVTADKLVAYAWIMTSIVALNFFTFAIYALLKFPEVSLRISRSSFDKGIMCQLVGFAGWTTFGTVSVSCRNQGISFVFNHFYNTILNAAYGIACQVYGAMVFVSTSVLNAMNPQIMKSAGASDSKSMLKLAGKESKFSVALMLIVSVPVMVEMQDILTIWLKDVPPYSVMFCRYLLLIFLCDQLTTGLNTAILALGQIRNYSLLVYTPKLLSLLLFYVMLDNGCNLEQVMMAYLAIELIVALIRMPYIKNRISFSITSYIRTTIIPLIPLAAALWLAALGMSEIMPEHSLSFLAVCAIASACGVVAAWHFVLDASEQTFITSHIRNITKR